jgi:hypothetical protein
VVTQILPVVGLTTGGTNVTISGTNLTGAIEVHFGTAAASSFICTATSCMATAPPGTGTVDVTVTTPGGTSAAVAADKFTYVARLSVSTTMLTEATAEHAYSATLAAAGGAGNVTWSVTAGSLPPGLTLHPDTGQITGTPTTAGSYTFTMQATDAGTLVQTATAGVSIRVVAPTITLVPASLPGAVGAVPYSTTLNASGGIGPYTFTLALGALPRGLALSSGGVLAGTPTAAGHYPFTVTATDADGFTGTASYTLVVSPGLSLRISGLGYTDSGPLTGGSLTVSPSGTGTVESITGTATIAGEHGGTATVTIQLWRFGSFGLFGYVKIDDPSTALRLGTPAFGADLTRIGPSAARGTLTWFAVTGRHIHRYTLTYAAVAA